MTINSPKIPATGKRAIFLDRDGVLNDVVDRGEDFFVQGKKVRWTAPFNYNEFRFKPGIVEVLEALGERGWLRILVTNQPDITYGTMPPEEHEKIMAEVKNLPLDDIYVCIHGRNDGCLCKKPLPGMLLTAAEKWGIHLPSSYMVGDTKSDLEAARAAGTRSIIISDGRNNDLASDWRAEELAAILDIIGE
ncbi:MAG: HAD-IIIA family hydrolase [Candidatus Magasanikbacteria bacterium]|nr:HAD-IIIA family hydrolase [Candidatus Magasanikbacteria bacterium]